MMIRKSVGKPSTSKSSLHTQSGKMYLQRLKTLYLVSKNIGRFIYLVYYLYIELLTKDREERISIKDTLDHPWFAGSNNTISEMRKQASGDQMMQFISYSHVDAKAAELAQKKSQGSHSPKSAGNFNGL